MPSGANHEHVTKPLVKDDFCRNARVTATKNHGCRMLRVDELRAVRDSLTWVLGSVGNKTLVTLTERFPCRDRV